ncbi:hypothetical protein TOPH_04865 [Tolypocladium ophioglossoides CBS 100239]|uniref:Aminoglycoside phosphotransferase domain-containing protein n=1 Tax=Tolypocladium ophioglossoides (strain CBS 100239) TaxID=1163406 RepID=A0A0L0N9B9_TOLOC|nr:hypothetical protein TOPH_04865 [Tolypocladium ophioglossoides CBS 100239]
MPASMLDQPVRSHPSRTHASDDGSSVQAVDTATSATGIKTPETDATEIEAGPDGQGFPTTDDQDHEIKEEFIESLDPDAVCALASRYNNGKPCQVVNKDSGSFNVCFFVKFDQDEPEWIVRVAIETSLDNPWDKLLSEVTTIQYLERNTRIPVPHVRAHGRNAKLTKSGSGTQVFLIADRIPGEPLDKKRLIEAEEEHRRNFYSQLIDILAELRKLEFPSIGSLMPNPNGSPHPVLGPVMPMSAATLRLPPLPILSSAKEYMRHQFGLVLEFFLRPVRDFDINDIRREMFALHHMERIFQQVIDPQLDEGPFVLNHLDLRSANTIVDENLRIQGIIDWEFTSTIPLQVFTPPSWITGHDSTKNKQMHTEFRDVLDGKSRTDSLCDQLSREWYGQLDADKSDMDQMETAFCVAHVLRRPTEAADTFCDFFAQKLSDKPLDDMISNYFNGQEALALEARRRAEQCERYAQYLKKHGLYETRLEKWLAKSKEFKLKWGWT